MSDQAFRLCATLFLILTVGCILLGRFTAVLRLEAAQLRAAEAHCANNDGIVRIWARTNGTVTVECNNGMKTDVKEPQ
jgi:hypothetical protein